MLYNYVTKNLNYPLNLFYHFMANWRFMTPKLKIMMMCVNLLV